MKDIITKYIEVFRYLLGYSWAKLYFDESNFKNDNFIFDINTASELPHFPFLASNPKLNPYMPILINDKNLNPQNNIGCVHDYIENPTPPNNEICNLEQFKIRLNIFCTNNSTYDIFKNVEFEKDKIAICGSVLAACLQKNHPLLVLFNKIDNYETKLARFFNEYYALADIDIIFLSNDILFNVSINSFLDLSISNLPSAASL